VGSERNEFWYCGDGWSMDTGLLGYGLLVDGERPHGFGLREVSQGFWKRIMGENPSRYAACGAECPVDSVSFCDALAFANRLSTLEGLPEAYDLSHGCAQARLIRAVGGYRLPTREEWLAEARIGRGPSPGAPPVDAAFGLSGPRAADAPLQDLVGSVGEWVWPARDGRADAMGGSWADAAPRRVEDLTRAWAVDARSEYVGLRLVRQAPPPTPATPVAPAR
jgi:formylglycine-generating enzyme required for sulfatase activity